MPRPTHVNLALVALSGAWLLSAFALATNQLLLGGSEIGPGPVAGMVSLLVQAGVIVFLARRMPGMRAFVVIFLMLSASALTLVPGAAARGSYAIAVYLAAGFLLKAGAAGLLFMHDSNRWFAEERSR